MEMEWHHVTLQPGEMFHGSLSCPNALVPLHVCALQYSSFPGTRALCVHDQDAVSSTQACC